MLLFLLFFTGLLTLSRSQLISPCPETFDYERNNTYTDRWYGTVKIRSTADLSGVWIRIVLDRPALHLANWFSEAISRDGNTVFVIKNPRHSLKAGEVMPLRFFVKYDPNLPVPKLEKVLLNGGVICGQTSTTSNEEVGLFISRPAEQVGLSVGGSGGSSWSGGTSSGSGSGTSSNYDGSSIHNTDSVVPLPESSSYGTANEMQPPSNRYDNDNLDYNRPLTRPVDVDIRTPNRPVSRPSLLSSPESGSSGNINEPNFGSSVNNNNNNNSNNKNSHKSQTNNRGGNQANSPSTPNQSTNHLFVGNDNDNFSTFDFFPGDLFLPSTGVQLPTIARPSSFPPKPKLSCGTVATQASPLISHGIKTSKGQWPWHAAIYHSQSGIQLTYTCGGTLISEEHILTAAHCVTKPHTNILIPTETVLVYLGKHSLNTFGPEVQDREVSKIYVHSQYNASIFFNDIAILKLKLPVEFNNYVRPACLWQGSTTLEEIIDKAGTVVGWGYDENKRLSTELMQTQMPVVSVTTCIYSKREFFSQFTFEKNYCAGFRNGTTVCNGDSGGGMVFPKSYNGNTVWEIRGIVSVSVALQGQAVCDPSQYMIFTDVAKYLGWIDKIMKL